MILHFRKDSYKCLLPVTMGTRWRTPARQHNSISPSKMWGSREHVLLLICQNLPTSSNEKKDFPQKTQKWTASERCIRLMNCMFVSGSSGPFLWCQIFVVSSASCGSVTFLLSIYHGRAGTCHLCWELQRCVLVYILLQ